LVNRCPHCRTVLSDIEIEHKEVQGKLYYIKYPLVDGGGEIVVATTRPETMLGDTAVAVHPEDERYLRFHGKKVLLPLVNRKIPVITDSRVEREFGTGAVKVTPAHDPVDFELSREHNLEQVIVIDGSGRMTEAAGPEFKGLDRFECRKKVLERLEEAELLVKVEDYQHMVGHCYRCKTIIEPHLSWQWFVKMGPLAKEAIRVVEEGTIEFIPANWAKSYFEWMYKIHDWCISRQRWWGHRIPAWYCRACGEIIVAMETPTKCPKCGGDELTQDGDVLDTWFSSALWPFGTMGWPEKTADLETFYPTDLMATAFDIIFFWVARMIMMGLKFTGKIPFRHVFINGLVRDFRRRKMSKSEGNIIDPLEMIDKYGTDALRFTMAALAIPGADLSLSEERMAGYRAFVNKIWNASRFVLMNLDDSDGVIKAEEMTLADRWIISRLSGITAELESALGQYKFYEAADKLYHFAWHEFCDWYIEMAKPSLKAGNKTTQAVLAKSLDHILRLLSPFMPFVTEEIWQHLPAHGKSLSLASFPRTEPDRRDERAEEEMRLLQGLVVEVRTIRAENKIPPQKKIEIWLHSPGEKEKGLIPDIRTYILTLANGTDVRLLDQFPAEKRLLKGVAAGWEVAIPLEGAHDLEVEIARLEKENKKIQAEIEKVEGRLKNKDFVERAPQSVIEEARQNLAELLHKKSKLEKNLQQIKP
jgi:valyl-tRNA synthetase